MTPMRNFELCCSKTRLNKETSSHSTYRIFSSGPSTKGTRVTNSISSNTNMHVSDTNWNISDKWSVCHCKFKSHCLVSVYHFVIHSASMISEIVSRIRVLLRNKDDQHSWTKKYYLILHTSITYFLLVHQRSGIDSQIPS